MSNRLNNAEHTQDVKIIIVGKIIQIDSKCLQQYAWNWLKKRNRTFYNAFTSLKSINKCSQILKK